MRMTELKGDVTRFKHFTALERLPTWHEAMPKPPSGVHIPGDIILREASAKVWQLLKTSDEFKHAPLYWSLQDFLGGNKCY